MKLKERPLVVCAGLLGFCSLAFFQTALGASGNVPPAPKFYLNGKPASVTVQDLSGLGTRPLRLMVQKNNRAHGDEFIQVYALGAREGEELRAEMVSPLPGVRMTIYKILHEPDGSRYVSMPRSEYFEKPGTTSYQEKLPPFREAFWIIVFEKTDSPDEKNINVRYFEERVRDLVIGSYKTNFLFSAIRLRMKDFGDPDTKGSFERDAQVLINRLVKPQRVFLVRIWKAGGPSSEDRRGHRY